MTWTSQAADNIKAKAYYTLPKVKQSVPAHFTVDYGSDKVDPRYAS